MIEFMKPDGTDVRAVVRSIRGEDGQERDSAPHPGERIEVSLELADGGVPETGDIIRRRETAG